MTPKQTRISAKFQSSKKLLITYLISCYPNYQQSVEAFKSCINNGADLIEIGVPFSDPSMDGKIIQNAGKQALSQHGNLKNSLKIASEIRQVAPDIPIVLMLYYNAAYKYNELQLVRDAKTHEVDGFIVPDLPFEESGKFNLECRKHGLSLIQFVSPLTKEDRIQKITASSQGFIYYISIAGITGSKEANLSTAQKQIKIIKKHTSTPVVVGFGIKTPSQARAICDFSDGFVVGSQLITTLDTGGISSLGHCVRDLKQATIL